MRAGSCPSKCPGTSFNYLQASVIVRSYTDAGGVGEEELAELPVCWNCSCSDEGLVFGTTGSYVAPPSAPRDTWVVATVVLHSSSASDAEELTLTVNYESQ